MNAHWLNALLSKALFSLIGACMVLSPLAIFLGNSEPSVEVVQPPASLLNVPAPATVATYAPDSDDFVTRPLFDQSRRPFVAVEIAKPAKVEKVPEPEKIDDATLSGVFVSQGTQGVIISVGKERFRVLVGEKFREWTLGSVEPRGAIFASGAGYKKRTARLEMALLNNPSPTSESRAGHDSAPISEDGDPAPDKDVEETTASNADNDRKSSKSVMGRLTFEKLYGEETPKKVKQND